MAEDTLERAKELAQIGHEEGTQTDIALSIAFALIALCERWDKATDEDGILHVNAMNFDAYRELA